MSQTGSIIPLPYTLPPREQVYVQQIIVNWLDQEIDPDAPRRMPILKKLTRWRNREVYYFIRDSWDWTARLYD
jgi:hypothetical protein